jgi:hypothetical protein
LLTSQACSAEIANTQVPPNGTEVNRNEQRRDINGNANRTNAQSESQTGQVDKTSIKNTKGVIVLSDRYGRKDFIRFYNEDRSLWYEFSFYYEQIGDRTFPENENFRAFAFHRDYFLLGLKCTGKDKDRYEVIVNEETGLKKFVKKDDPALKFETWEDHIVKAFAVEFDPKENGLRDAPGGKVKDFDLPEDATFHPVQVNGEWLKVRWDASQQLKKDAGSGWVKWKDDNHILVELFYFA